ncbi:unnamed protein product [Orchesella dallaii]|uniref:Zonadhesin n=1 Tax=Orchesella dallaii TaxID=48710 RepID=A0ABP1RYX1_9HEXA
MFRRSTLTIIHVTTSKLNYAGSVYVPTPVNEVAKGTTNHHTVSSVEAPTLSSLTEPSSYSTTDTPPFTASAITSKLDYTRIVGVPTSLNEVPTAATNHHTVSSVEPPTLSSLTEPSSYSTTETPPSTVSTATSKLDYTGIVGVPTPVNEVATVTAYHHTVSSVEPPTLTSLTELSSYSTTETQVSSTTARVITSKLNYAGIVSVPSPATEVATVTTNNHTISSVKPPNLSSLTEVSSNSTTESPPSTATNITHVGTVPTTGIKYLKTVRHINASDEGLSNLLLRSNSENKTNYEIATPCSFAQTSMFDKVTTETLLMAHLRSLCNEARLFRRAKERYDERTRGILTLNPALNRKFECASLRFLYKNCYTKCASAIPIKASFPQGGTWGASELFSQISYGMHCDGKKVTALSM